MNKKQKIGLGVIAGIIIALLLSGGGFLLYRALSGNAQANDPSRLRLNTLTLVRNYVDKDEFDRALSLLEGLLIQNPEDTEATELMDAVLAAKKAKEAREAGTGDSSEIDRALADARSAAARIAKAADEAQRAASRMSAADTDRKKKGLSAEDSGALDDSPGTSSAKKGASAQSGQSADSQAEADRQRKEQAAADEAKRKALEDELAKKNGENQKKIAEVNAAIAKGKAAAESGSLRSALSSFDDAEKALPDGEKAFAAQKYAEMAESLYGIAQNATDSTVKNEALASALEYANKAVEADGSLASARYIRSKIYADQQKGELALQDLKEAVRLDPQNYLYAYDLGKMYYLQKRYADAKQCFTTVTKLAPKFEPAFFNLGLTNKALGSVDESLAAFRQATVIKTDYTRAYIEIARLLDRKGDSAGAINAYGAALKIEPSNVSALREMAALYSKNRKFAEAERYFREALTLGS
ncbi:MAG TPA: tetratricopeptide repeat protein, partial [Treponemataceae bacterium]|nr:tetratricopeptide repeat protein [Treponemataceae bacterium]